MREVTEELVASLEALIRSSQASSDRIAASREQASQLEDELERRLKARASGVPVSPNETPSVDDVQDSDTSEEVIWMAVFGALMRLYAFPDARPVCDEIFAILSEAKTLDFAPTAEIQQGDTPESTFANIKAWKDQQEAAMDAVLIRYDELLNQALDAAKRFQKSDASEA